MRVSPLTKYRVVLASQPQKQLDRSDPQAIQRLDKALVKLADNPQRGKLLHGHLRGSRSFRVGEWRIVYHIDGQLINVELIEWRDKAYR